MTREPGDDVPAQASLFSDDPSRSRSRRRNRRRSAMRGYDARVASSCRWGRVDLDAALPADHAARAIVAVVDRLDLRALYAGVRARGETAGAAAIDPKILLALWIYATSDGVGSGARSRGSSSCMPRIAGSAAASRSRTTGSTTSAASTARCSTRWSRRCSRA